MKRIVLLLLSVSLSAHAFGTVEVKGKVTAFDAKTVTLKLADQSSIKLERTALSPADRERLAPDVDVSASVDERVFKKALIKPKK